MNLIAYWIPDNPPPRHDLCARTTLHCIRQLYQPQLYPGVVEDTMVLWLTYSSRPG